MSKTILNAASSELDRLKRRLDQLKESKADPSEWIEVFLKVREAYRTLDEARKEFGKIKDHLAYTAIPQQFELHDLKTVTYKELSVRVTISQQTRASIKSGQKDEALKWLRDKGHGDMIQETVNASTLSAFAKSQMEQAVELPDDVFNVSVNDITSVTKV